MSSTANVAPAPTAIVAVLVIMSQAIRRVAIDRRDDQASHHRSARAGCATSSQ
eukprot:SAG31_NODE_33935_length_338_cov_1.083682_1_plen_52_part_10